MVYSNFIMHVQRTEAAIASQQPNSEAQRYMIKLCSEINNATEGCTEYYHRNHYELVKTESTSKQTDKGRVRGVKFTVAYHVPILQKITRVLGVLSTPIPLKKENDEYFYMSFEVPDVIGYSEESKKAFSMDKCEVVPHLKTRFCKMGLLTRKSSEMDCSTAILENVPHRYCESSVYSSPSDRIELPNNSVTELFFRSPVRTTSLQQNTETRKYSKEDKSKEDPNEEYINCFPYIRKKDGRFCCPFYTKSG